MWGWGRRGLAASPAPRRACNRLRHPLRQTRGCSRAQPRAARWSLRAVVPASGGPGTGCRGRRFGRRRSTWSWHRQTKESKHPAAFLLVPLRSHPFPAGSAHPSGNVGCHPSHRPGRRGVGKGLGGHPRSHGTREAEHPRTATRLCTACYPAAAEPRERRAHARAEPGGLGHPSPSPWAMGDSGGAACFPLASSAPRPTWALRSITLHRSQGALSSLSKVTLQLARKAPRACAAQRDPPRPTEPLPHLAAGKRRGGDAGTPRPVAWVGVRGRGGGWLLLPCVEPPKTTIQRPDLHFTKSPAPPQPQAPANHPARSLPPPRGTATGRGWLGEWRDALHTSPPALSPSLSPQRCPALG